MCFLSDKDGGSQTNSNMHVTLFNLYEDLNTVLQCPIQIVECESLAIMETGDAKPGHVGGLVCRAVSDISHNKEGLVRV